MKRLSQLGRNFRTHSFCLTDALNMCKRTEMSALISNEQTQRQTASLNKALVEAAC